MKTRLTACAVLACAAALVPATIARGQPYTLRHLAQPGDQYVFEQTLRTETVQHRGENSRRTVTEQTGTREELTVEAKMEPPSVRVVIFEPPQEERLVSLEENGKDRLPDVPENARRQTSPPQINLDERGLRGEPAEPIKPVENPTVALSLFFGATRYLPEQAVSPGDEWSHDADFGAVRGTVKTKFVEVKTVGGLACAVLDVTATAALAGEIAGRITVEKIESRMSVALDGSGLQHITATNILGEKGDAAEQRVTRTFEAKRVKTARLEGDDLAKARADAERLRRAFEQAQSDDLAAAVETLQAYIQEMPDGRWTPAVKTLHANVLQRRLLTKPLPQNDLRVVLRDLRRAHDQANAQGNPADLAAVRNAAGQVAAANLQAILKDSSDEDPVIRELALFGMTFSADASARQRLVEMTKDTSRSVRAAAAIGLAVQQKPVDSDLLLRLLKDPEEQARGAAAILAYRTLKREDAGAAKVLPILIENLAMKNLWARAQTVGAIGLLAPAGSTQAVGAVLGAFKAETAGDLKPIYLNALEQITGVKGEDVSVYEAWQVKQAAPEKGEPKPGETGEPKEPKPAPKDTPKG
ncbi:MAG: HEAT repeat domain-containing protein [Planctomycetota bacterium]|nr:HEAT repeat domain-containing protein [Planctomycetota bacterium]